MQMMMMDDGHWKQHVLLNPSAAADAALADATSDPPAPGTLDAGRTAVPAALAHAPLSTFLTAPGVPMKAVWMRAKLGAH